MIRKVILFILLLLMFHSVVAVTSHAAAIDVTGEMVYYWGDLQQYSGWDSTKKELIKDANGPTFNFATGWYNDVSVLNWDIKATLSDQVEVGTRLQTLFSGNPAWPQNYYFDQPRQADSWWGTNGNSQALNFEYNQSEPAKNMYISVKNVFDLADIHIADNTRLSRSMYSERTAFFLHSIINNNPGGVGWNGVNRGWMTWPEGTTQFAPGITVNLKPVGPLTFTVAANDAGNRSNKNMITEIVAATGWDWTTPNNIITNGTITTDKGTVVRATNGYMINCEYATPLSGITVGAQWEAVINYRQNMYFWTQGMYKGVTFLWSWIQQDAHGILKDEGYTHVATDSWLSVMLTKATASVLNLKYNLMGVQLSGVYSYATNGMERWDSWHDLGNVDDYWLQGQYPMMDGNLTPKVAWRGMRQTRTKNAILVGADYILAPGVTVSPEIVFDNQTQADGVTSNTWATEYKNRAYAIFITAEF